MRLIKQFREKTVADASKPITAARNMQPKAFERLVRDVESKLIDMPLGRLQIIGTENKPFIYTLGWNAMPKASTVKRDDFDGRLHLAPNAGAHLLRANALIRPLVQRSWALMVRRLNDELAEDRLEEYLFGENRISLAPVAPDLRELAEGRCFYCGKAVKAKAQIDHLIPFARHIDNSLSNLVYAHDGCNGKKSSRLAAEPHLEHWMTRITDTTSAGALTQLATELSWDYEPDRTLGSARAIYLGLPDGYALWQHADELTPIEADRVRAALKVSLV